MTEVYSHKEHYERLCRWLAHHGIKQPDKEFFSDIGFCIDGIAIGFLFTTNSKLCYMDNVAADPDAKPEVRELALDKLFRRIEIEACAHGKRLLIAACELPSLKLRLMNHGYQRHGEMTLFYKRFGG